MAERAPRPHAALLAAYLERRGDLVRVFTARLQSAARAEDLVQRMYERLLAVPAEEPIASPLAYLHRLGSNLMVDDLRQRRRQGERERAWSDLQGVAVGGERASDAPSAEEALIARQRLAKLMAGVERLPARAREVFTLHKLQGLSHGQTAAALGVSKSAVEKHMILALKLLTEQLR